MAKIRTAAASAAHSIKLAIGRAVLAAVNDSAKRQMVQFEALKGEVKDGVERVQQYGFTSVPLPGAQVVFVCVGGNRDHPLAISVDDPRYRKANLQPGEVALFTDEGDAIYLRRGNVVEITTKQLVVKAEEFARFETPILEVTGHIIDQCDTDGISMHAMRQTYNLHTHDETESVTEEPNQQMGGGA